MKERIYKTYERILTRAHAISFAGGALFLFVSLIIQKIADNYLITLNEPPVRDIILDSIPNLNIDGFIIFSALLLSLIVLILALSKPKYINFGIKSVALFILTRSFFISLTHFGANPHQVIFDPSTPGYALYDLLYNTHNDFFFSGHTGLPFILALIFWPEKRLRYIFFCLSFIFGASVLFGHIHYSIDVFAAPFITYSIFILSKKLFKGDYDLSRAE